MERLEREVPFNDVTSFTLKNVALLFIGIFLFISIYKFFKNKNKISETKHNNEIDQKMKIAREKKLQELEREMIANKEKIKERIKKREEKEEEEKNKTLDSSKKKLGSKENSSFNHFKDYSSYYRPSIRNRYKNTS